MKVSAKAKGNILEFKVGADSILTALSTALSILRDASLFEEVWLLSHKSDAKVRS